LEPHRRVGKVHDVVPVAVAFWYGDFERRNREVTFMKIEIEYCGK
jgi:hypothetical protein